MTEHETTEHEMIEHNTQSWDVRRVADLMQLEGDLADWDQADLRAILDHQLSILLCEELTEFFGHSREIGAVLESAKARGITTFADAFIQPDPPVDLLNLIKRYCKRQSSNSGAIPREAARVLYLAALSAAEVRCRQSISEMESATLTERLAWGRAQTWADPMFSLLFEEALNVIEQDRHTRDSNAQ